VIYPVKNSKSHSWGCSLRSEGQCIDKVRILTKRENGLAEWLKWQNTCLAIVRHWVQTPGPQKRIGNLNKSQTQTIEWKNALTELKDSPEGLTAGYNQWKTGSENLKTDRHWKPAEKIDLLRTKEHTWDCNWIFQQKLLQAKWSEKRYAKYWK
jgi:hypothetical protein